MQQKDFVLIGHVTRDINPDGDFIPGGPVTYAGITLALRGHNIQILTKVADNEPLLDNIRDYGIDVVNLSETGDTRTTTYTNIYNEYQQRTQYISEIAERFTSKEIQDITSFTKGKRTLVLPVANEIPSTFYKPLASSAEMLVAAPQGSLRRWADNGKVFHMPFSKEYAQALQHCHIMTISNEDMDGFTDSMKSDILHHTADTVILTNGRDGADLYQNHHATHVPPFRLQYETEELGGYPTGNGDHMTAIIAEGAPPYLEKLSDPFTYEQEMYEAASRGAFLTALKIMKRDGVEDGIGSLRGPDEVREWSRQNLKRIREYADYCNLDPSVFIEGSRVLQEGSQNFFYRR